MSEVSGQPIPQQPINGQPSGLTPPKKRSMRKILFWAGSVAIAVILGVIVSGFIWYNAQIAPVGSDVGVLKKITIAAGSSPSQIGKELKDESIIRSSTAFDIYIRLFGKTNNLKAGTYRLSPAETIPQIVDHLVKGSVDQFSITFYPGATLIDNVSKTKKYDVTTVLKNAGYSDSEIAAAFNATYENPLFAGKPTGTDLEGYIYGETYNFNVGASVQDIFERTFEEFYNVVQENDLIKAFQDRNLTLYQGITLASIVQRESNAATDQKQVAQVFYSRLAIDMVLGSDVTYQYIADKTGVPRDPNMISPYNTRNTVGLPPGPIASPGLTSLLAVANPADGDYLYFLGGDDDVTHFANTFAEHEANIVNYCQIKCAPGRF